MSACSVCNRYPCPGCLGAAHDEIERIKLSLSAAENWRDQYKALLEERETELEAVKRVDSEIIGYQISRFESERALVDKLVDLHWKWDTLPADSVEENNALLEIDKACLAIERDRAAQATFDHIDTSPMVRTDRPAPPALMNDNSPPWILFIDSGKPVAILPAGRPGEVANVSHLSMKQAQKIVNMANRIHEELAEAKLQHLWAVLEEATLLLAKTGATK